MLTAQKRKYALALMSGMSQKDAAIKAGYSEKSARSRGRSLLKTRRSSRLLSEKNEKKLRWMTNLRIAEMFIPQQ